MKKEWLTEKEEESFGTCFAWEGGKSVTLGKERFDRGNYTD